MSKINKNKSKELIAQSFLNQISVKPLSKITIKSIVDSTNLSRRSFYNNFDSIYDVILYIEKSIDDEIYQKIIDTEVKPSDDPVDILIDIIAELIYERRDLQKIMYSPNLSGIWSAYLEDKYTNLAMEYVFAEYSSTDIPKSIACHYFIQSFLHIISLWITQPIPDNPEKFKKLFKTLMKTSMVQLPDL